LTWSKRPDATAVLTYLQVFRSGVLESKDGFVLWMDPKIDTTIIPGYVVEKRILETLPRYFDILRQLGVEPPVLVMLTFLGVRGREVVEKRGISTWAHPIDRDDLFIPEVTFEDFGANPDRVLKSAFDVLWNASGWEGSQHHDDDGNWEREE
jgi:hypothetical protein